MVVPTPKGPKTALGILGVVMSIVSIWWFALRPRRGRRDGS